MGTGRSSNANEAPRVGRRGPTSAPGSSRGSRSAPASRSPPQPMVPARRPRWQASSPRALTVLVALFLTDLFSGLPEATLGGIVLVAGERHDQDTADQRSSYGLRKTDFALALAATLAVLSLDTLAALVFAVALSIVLLVVEAARAPLRRLGEQPGGAFVDLERNPEARRAPWDARGPTRRRAVLRQRGVRHARRLHRSYRERATGARGRPRPRADLPAGRPFSGGSTTARPPPRGGGHPARPRPRPWTVVEMLEKTGVVEAVGRERVGGRVEDAVRALEL